jgi:hypothetical protein
MTPERPSHDLYDHLVAIQRRPLIYLRDLSLDELERVCHGYVMALRAHGIEEFGSDFDERFDDFLRRRYEWDTSRGWAPAIRDQCPSDQDAFHRFFELLEEFRAAGA